MLDGIIGLGPWGYENIGAEARSAFVFKMRFDGVVMMVDGDAEPWADASILGKRLSREDVLSHEWYQDALDVIDHMVLEDREIRTHFLSL